VREKKACPLCGNEAESQYVPKEGRESALFVDCPACKWLSIGSSLLPRLERGEYKGKLYLLSALSRRNHDRQQPRPINTGTKPFVLTSETIDGYLEGVAVPDEPLDRVDRLLHLTQERTESFDKGGEVNPKTDFPLLFLRSREEYEHVVTAHII